MHFCAAIFWHKLAAIVRLYTFLVQFWTNFHSIWCKFNINFLKLMQKQQHLIVLFRMNLVATLAPKHKKVPYLMPEYNFFLQISFIFDAHFSLGCLPPCLLLTEWCYLVGLPTSLLTTNSGSI